jgi:hypothetical protein
MRLLLIRDPKCGLPSCSWWTTCTTREEFQRAAAAERSRTAWSKFGRLLGTTVLEND